MPAELRLGETLGGYVVETPLGRGGMGAVYLATHTRLARKVALKVIAPELAHDAGFRERFLRESRLAASLDHPNVIPIYDAGEVDGVLYLAMRYVSGSSLHELIRDRGPLSLAETQRIAGQIGGALDAAHKAGLVHQDVKPANILLDSDGHAYLCDFGLARRTSSQAATQAGSFLGTVDYCAPEQIEGRPVDGRVDVYSLGCVLFHCLAGRPPYVRDTDFAVLNAHVSEPPPLLSGVRSDLPRELDAVLARAMAKDPASRYPTAGALAAACGGEDAAATRAAPITAEQRRRRPGRRVLVIFAAIVVAAGGTTAGLLATGSGGGSTTELRTFVDRVENVLVQSSAGRREIGDALTAGRTCAISAREAGRRIGSVADNRQSILDQLGNLRGPTQQTDDVVTLLQQALQHSIEADRHYRDGFLAADPGSPCPLPTDEGFRLAARSDAQATVAKRRFVAAFDPLAARFDRRVWSANEI